MFSVDNLFAYKDTNHWHLSPLNVTFRWHFCMTLSILKMRGNKKLCQWSYLLPRLLSSGSRQRCSGLAWRSWQSFWALHQQQMGKFHHEELSSIISSMIWKIILPLFWKSDNYWKKQMNKLIIKLFLGEARRSQDYRRHGPVRRQEVGQHPQVWPIRQVFLV